jgi:hypothetical protein
MVDPSLLASCLCPEGDTKCVDAILGSFKNAFTTLLLSIICAVEIVALCSIRCLSQRTPEDSELDKVIIDRGALSQSLLHDDWEARRDEFEARSKRRLEQQRAALSSVAKKGLQVHVCLCSDVYTLHRLSLTEVHIFTEYKYSRATHDIEFHLFLILAPSVDTNATSNRLDS